MRALGDQRDETDVKAFASFCRLFLRAYENYDYDFDRNGEAWLLEQLRSLRPKIVFDVGANVGDWSARAALAFPQAAIHAFEPVPDTAPGKLEARAPPWATRVKANAFGLSDRDGAVALTVMDDDSTLRSIVVLHEGARRQIDCAMRAGDAYMAEQGIERIDFPEDRRRGRRAAGPEGLRSCAGGAAGRRDPVRVRPGQYRDPVPAPGLPRPARNPWLYRRQAVSGARRLPPTASSTKISSARTSWRCAPGAKTLRNY